MPFERNPDTGKMQFSFTNLLALLVVCCGFAYFYWISFVMTTREVKDNPSLQQITIFIVTIVTAVISYYFGNSNNSAKQAQQIKEMQRTATEIAVKTADATIATVSAASAKTDLKVSKAERIAELKAELEKLEPDSDDAKSILAELEKLEKKD